MKRILILFVSLLLLSGCKKHCCTNISASLFLKYQNSNGENLLDPKTSNALLEDNIDVYVLRNGTRVRIYNAMMDAPKSFKIRSASTQENVMTFYFDIAKESFSGKKVTMYLTYKDGSEDKLVGEFNESGGSSIILQSVWINDIARGRPSYSPSEAFIIKK